MLLSWKRIHIVVKAVVVMGDEQRTGERGLSNGFIQREAEPMLESLWLVHPDDAMCAAFRERFAGLPNVRVVRGRFEGLEPHDCFVTAGNAFGLMTAGIDAAVVRRFGEGLMQLAQHRILSDYF